MGVVDYSGDVRVYISSSDVNVNVKGNMCTYTNENGCDVSDAGLSGCATGSDGTDGEVLVSAKPRISPPPGMSIDDVKLAFMHQLHLAGVMHFRLDESAQKADLMRAYRQIFEPIVMLQALPRGAASNWCFRNGSVTGDVATADNYNGNRRPRKNNMRGPKCARRRLQQKKLHSTAKRGRPRATDQARSHCQLSDTESDLEHHGDKPGGYNTESIRQNISDPMRCLSSDAHSCTPDGMHTDVQSLSLREGIQLDAHSLVVGGDVYSLVDDRVMSMSSLLYQHKDIARRGEMSPTFRHVHARRRNSPQKSSAKQKSPAKLSPQKKRGSGLLQKLRRSVFKSKKFTQVKRPMSWGRSRDVLPERPAFPSFRNVNFPIIAQQQLSPPGPNSRISPSRLAVWCDNDRAVALNSDEESGWMDDAYDCRGADHQDAVPEVAPHISNIGGVLTLPCARKATVNLTDQACPFQLPSTTSVCGSLFGAPSTESDKNNQATYGLPYRDSPLSSSSDMISNWQWLELIPIIDSTAGKNQPGSDNDTSTRSAPPLVVTLDTDEGAAPASSCHRAKSRRHLVVSNILQVIDLPVVDSEVRLTVQDLLCKIEDSQCNMIGKPLACTASSGSRSQSATNSCRSNRLILPHIKPDTSSNQQDEDAQNVYTDHNESRVGRETGTAIGRSSDVAEEPSLFFHPCQMPKTVDNMKPRILIRLVNSAPAVDGTNSANCKRYQCRIEGNDSTCSRVGSSRGRTIHRKRSRTRMKMPRKPIAKKKNSTGPRNSRRDTVATRKKVLAEDALMVQSKRRTISSLPCDSWTHANAAHRTMPDDVSTEMDCPLVCVDQQPENASLTYPGERLSDSSESAGDRDSPSPPHPSIVNTCDIGPESAPPSNTQGPVTGRKPQGRLKKRRKTTPRGSAKPDVKKPRAKKAVQCSPIAGIKTRKRRARRCSTRKRKSVDGDVEAAAEQTTADGTLSSTSRSGKCIVSTR